MRLLMGLGENITVCHTCPHRQQRCDGSCLCMVSGKEFLDHAEQHDCPLERFPSRGLGDTVAKVIHTVTLGTVGKCGGCAERQAALNERVPYDQK